MSTILDQDSAAARATSAAMTLKGVHHTAFRCRDAEETRHFYEDILGLKLKVSLMAEDDPMSGARFRYMHLFFAFGDNSFIAFFDTPDSPQAESFAERSFFDIHYAMEAESRAQMMAYKQRLEDHGIEVMGPVDHGLVESIYFRDPNRVNLEITCRTAQHDAIVTAEAAEAHALLADWQRRLGRG